MAKKRTTKKPPAPAPAPPEPRRLGIITIVEDGTVMTGNVTPDNALRFAQILAVIQNQILGTMQPAPPVPPVENGIESQAEAQEA